MDRTVYEQVYSYLWSKDFFFKCSIGVQKGALHHHLRNQLPCWYLRWLGKWHGPLSWPHKTVRFGEPQYFDISQGLLGWAMIQHHGFHPTSRTVAKLQVYGHLSDKRRVSYVTHKSPYLACFCLHNILHIFNHNITFSTNDSNVMVIYSQFQYSPTGLPVRMSTPDMIYPARGCICNWGLSID